MPTEEEWKELKAEKRDEIQFGEAVKITADRFNIETQSFPQKVKLAYEQIKKAHKEVFGE